MFQDDINNHSSTIEISDKLNIYNHFKVNIMFEIKVKAEQGTYNVNIPTSLNDITSEFLEGIGKQINVADNYSLVALSYRETFGNLLLAGKNKGKVNASVVPIMVKKGATDNKFINSINVNDKLIITGTDLSRAIHVNLAGNSLNIDAILSICMLDKPLYQKNIGNRTPCYFLEFKLVPNCDIHGCYQDAEAPKSYITITPNEADNVPQTGTTEKE